MATPIMALITITMIEQQALQRLLAWASPAFPVGAFAYSAGLETAIAQDRVRGREAVQDWIDGTLKAGSVRNDAIFLAEAHRSHSDTPVLAELCDLCLVLTAARQRRDEMLVTGHAFLEAARAWPDPVHDRLPARCPYPLAFGAVAGAANIDIGDTLIAFLTSYVQAQISVAIRLVPIGQSDGLAALAALEPAVAACADQADMATLDDLGSIGLAAEIAAMAHETLGTRIFRS